MKTIALVGLSHLVIAFVYASASGDLFGGVLLEGASVAMVLAFVIRRLRRSGFVYQLERTQVMLAAAFCGSFELAAILFLFTNVSPIYSALVALFGPISGFEHLYLPSRQLKADV